MLTPPKQISTEGLDDGSVVSIVDGVSAWAMPWSIVNVSAATYNESRTSGEVFIVCDCTSNPITVNLPTAIGNTCIVNVKRAAPASAVNAVTIEAFEAQTIDGGLTAIISVQWVCLTLISNGSNWLIK